MIQVAVNGKVHCTEDMTITLCGKILPADQQPCTQEFLLGTRPVCAKCWNGFYEKVTNDPDARG